MQASEAIVKILEKEGITDAFGIPGAGINCLYKYLEKAPIKHYLMRHEEAAVHAADGYYRAAGKPALAICTSGPGATNFVTGLYTAWQDSIPLIAITGQAVTAQLGKGAFQCVNIAEIVKTVCKKSWCVTNANTIPTVFREAFETALSGRPGPVLIDLPLDVQMANIEFDINEYTLSKIKTTKPSKASIEKTVKLLDEAKNPVIIMGGGVILAHAEKELVQFAEYMGIPVITTYMAKGGIPVDHPLNAGQAGIQVGAASSGNEVFLGADVVLGIGCRFTDRHTGNSVIYQGERKFIHIDIDPNELGKIIKTELGIIADAADAVPMLLEAARTAGKVRTRQHPSFAEMRKKFIHYPDSNKKVMDPREVFEVINQAFDDETQYTTGCGITQIWSGQYQRINKPRKYFPSGGAGTLGYDIPAAIGAVAGSKGKKTACLIGDFGFTFLVEEIAVAAVYKMPVIVLIINNAYLGLIRQNQNKAFNYEYEVRMEYNKGVMDYVKVAEGFACKAERVFTYPELEKALKNAIAAQGPYVIDIVVEDTTYCDMGNDIAHINHF
ncbi:thiamine pyrophosphate-binding protein [Leadbettera azotonutricia]|uniref:Thiamine pyrophosphate enzyme n=1 Tax=Leadbettera azotonutricia (strain ATCC BAA-888 / DSM 13862 / ZAS-9) TaxID=545695 RepID=F5YG88_LEAAZ|nr:thiamine pyrophosphate-binding protein [Leadbettera azotonutricia]AEF80918.1 thiamine pyrophosphate enzyme [Leadbettera azotonutricia ZAS-9]